MKIGYARVSTQDQSLALRRDALRQTGWRQISAETLYRKGTLSVRAIAEKLTTAKSTLYVYVRHRGVPIGPSQQYPLPADSPQCPRVRHLQVGEERLSSHTALGDLGASSFSPQSTRPPRGIVQRCVDEKVEDTGDLSGEDRKGGKDG